MKTIGFGLLILGCCMTELKIDVVLPINEVVDSVYYKHVMGKNLKKVGVGSGRHNNHNSKLSDQQVMEVRYLYNHLGWNDKVVARKFNVAEGTVYRIRNYVTRLSVIAPFDKYGFDSVLAEKWGRENGLPTKGGLR